MGILGRSGGHFGLLGQDPVFDKNKALSLLANITPGVGDYLAHQEATKKYGKAVDAFKRGEFGNAALYAGGGLGDDLTTIPGIGDVAMLGKSLAGVFPLMTAFHGTPHKILPEDAPKFDLEKIGTGEGAQAYGHGIYLAEDPKIAGHYQSVLSNNGPMYKGKPFQPGVMNDGGRDIGTNTALKVLHDNFVDVEAGDLSGVRATLRQMAETKERGFSARKALENLDDIAKDFSTKGGALYEVDLPDPTIEKMLDWDAPLGDSKQGKLLRDSIPIEDRQAIIEDLFGPSSRNFPEMVEKFDLEGGVVYRELSKLKGSQLAASEYLNSLGIPGIKYFDAGSRGAKEGTKNFVIFNPDDVKILGTK